MRASRQGIKGRGNRVPKVVFDRATLAPDTAITSAINRAERRANALAEVKAANEAIDAVALGPVFGKRPSLQWVKEEPVMPTVSVVDIIVSGLSWSMMDVLLNLKLGYRAEHVARITGYEPSVVRSVAEAVCTPFGEEPVATTPPKEEKAAEEHTAPLESNFKHGLYGYQRRCRCETCKTAKSEEMKRYAARKKEKLSAAV